MSRVHVDDLAALTEAGLLSNLTGAWPVADEMPSTSAEIERWLLNGPPVEEAPPAGRSVNGSAVFRALGLHLSYPSWKSGIPACLEQES